MEDGRQGEDHQIIPVGLIQETAPVISPVARHPFSQLLVRIIAFCQEGGNTHEDKGRVVKAVLGGNLEGLLRRGGRRNGSRTHRAIVGHYAEDPFGLYFRLGNCSLRGLGS
jgi:hypothetical protein